MAGLNGDDGSCRSHVLGGADEWEATKVGSNSDVLNCGSEVEEGGWGAGREVVSTWLDGVTSKLALKKADVDGFLGTNGLNGGAEVLNVLVCEGLVQ